MKLTEGGDNDSLEFTGTTGDFAVFTFGSNTVLFAAGDGSTTGLFGAVACESVLVEGPNGSERYYVESTVAPTPVTINGNDGDDTFLVGNRRNSLDVIQGALFINGNAPAASDVLKINDQGEVDSNSYTATSTTVDRAGAATITYDTVERLEINAGSNADIFTVRSTATSTPAILNGNDGDDTFYVGVGNLNPVAGRVTVSAGGGHDSIFVQDGQNALLVDYLVTPDFGDLQQFAGRSAHPACPHVWRADLRWVRGVPAT